jgi:hypothetical protein
MFAPTCSLPFAFTDKSVKMNLRGARMNLRGARSDSKTL